MEREGGEGWGAGVWLGGWVVRDGVGMLSSGRVVVGIGWWVKGLIRGSRVQR